MVREATGPKPKIVVKLEIDGVSLAMELDTHTLHLVVVGGTGPSFLAGIGW